MTGDLDEARENFFHRITNGDRTCCPVCDRRARVRARKLNAGMAWMLVKLYSYTKKEEPIDGWIHVTKVFLAHRHNAIAKEYPKLEYWGLVERGHNDDETKRGSGFWRLTKRGIEFVQGKTRLPWRAFVAEPGFDNRVLGFDDKKTTSIKEALGDKFDYDELMARVRMPGKY